MAKLWVKDIRDQKNESKAFNLILASLYMEMNHQNKFYLLLHLSVVNYNNALQNDIVNYSN